MLCTIVQIKSRADAIHNAMWCLHVLAILHVRYLIAILIINFHIEYKSLQSEMKDSSDIFKKTQRIPNALRHIF